MSFIKFRETEKNVKCNFLMLGKLHDLINLFFRNRVDVIEMTSLQRSASDIKNLQKLRISNENYEHQDFRFW